MGVYRIQESLLGPAERSLHQALSLVVCQRGLIFPKVKLSQLFATDLAGERSTPAEKSTTFLNQEVDFLICERFTTHPILAVLLHRSDAPVTTEAQQQAAAICAEAGLPLLLIEQRAAYRMDELLAAIEPYLQGNQPLRDFYHSDQMQAEPRPTVTVPVRKTAITPKPASCPQCGVPLTPKMLNTYYQGAVGSHCRCRHLH